LAIAAFLVASMPEYDHNGRIVRVKPGAYRDEETFKSDPMKGMADLIARLKANGITDEGAQRDYLTQIFGNRNAAQMAMTLGYQYARLMRGAQGIENTQDIVPSADELLKNNPYSGWNRFTSALTNAGAAIGADLMPAATWLLGQLTAGAKDARNDVHDLPALEAIRRRLFGLPSDNSRLGDLVPQIGAPQFGNAVNPALWRDVDFFRRYLSGNLPGQRSYLNQPNLQGIGAPGVPGVAKPANVSPVTVNVPLTKQNSLTTNVYLDGKAIAGAVAAKITESVGRVTTGPNVSDGQSMPIYPDHVMHGPH
jgi:hypothetical protein